MVEMLPTDEKRPALSFTDFVDGLIPEYPHLKSLRRFLHHRTKPGGFEASQTFSDQHVDVITVDILQDGQVRHTETLKDIESLKRSVAGGVSDKSARLYLVQDLSPGVIEVLGSRFSCDPDFFASHLLHTEYMGLLALPSYTRNSSFISVPFDRSIRCKSRLEDQKRTIPRRILVDHDHAPSLEERVSMTFVGGQYPNSWTGIILFDSFKLGKGLGVLELPKHMPLGRTPCYHPYSDPEVLKTDESLRGEFLRYILSPRFNGHVAIQAQFEVVWVVLKLVSLHWAKMVEDQEAWVDAQHWYEIQEGFKDCKTTLFDKESRANYLSECKEMLNAAMEAVLNTPKLTGSSYESNEKKADSLIRDFTYLSTRISAQAARSDALLLKFSALAAVEESRKAIKQAESMRSLTVLATFFIPLSFVASIFGMNFREFDPQSLLSLWVYFIVALPVTGLSFIMLGFKIHFYWPPLFMRLCYLCHKGVRRIRRRNE